MRFQKDENSCGIFAILNAAQAVGVKLTQRAIRAHTGTLSDGTTEHGIMNALERLGFKAEAFHLPWDEAWKKLHESVARGTPVILCVEDVRHWVSAVGVCGKRVITFDSWKSKANQDVGGTEVWDKRSLKYWWTPTQGKYYGIVMERTK